MSLLLFDALLCLLLLALALASMLSRQLAHAVILYIAFGLLMALAWARLAAPDLALAEAAIGAGLTGALCFSALARQGPQLNMKDLSWRQRLWPALFVVIILSGLLSAVLQIPLQPGPLLAVAEAELADSGVSHPVTAVLLNFRSWDTLLELLVLLLALVGTLQVAPARAHSGSWALSRSWSQLLAPLVLLLAGYVLWAGASQPGGAFQAGALLAAGAVVLRLNQQLNWLHWGNVWIRLLAVSGVAMFTLSGLFALLLSGSAATAIWLQWPVALAGSIILLIELFASLAIAISLTLLVMAEQPVPRCILAGPGTGEGVK
ncbi:sodium:proton antiporter [Arsukibacterium ikkense]|uniref:Sodium:proton antiporter n=1 Tax=Arsukibacterium ikkense TaxID=336831 RepID=A0A0M2V4L8_9GAMM|nr:hydrogenase subunit MbhD domain-containing protein [Arsukibacterium ikkense]KKO45349.1 sodium:proton antiporter [Arsukibacterium ikkense]